ncbi:unnamed protein product [Thlaspi arvense]|uniref:Uncharacterized protein n=1 Tax=Thlaspi arvense TaxID=13288 RepID=A0AAU9RLR0_THLAR|nr:unnamed protein product [Thlaspi arvense]
MIDQSSSVLSLTNPEIARLVVNWKQKARKPTFVGGEEEQYWSYSKSERNSLCFHGNQEQRRKTTKKSEVSDSSSDLFEIENLTGKPKPCLTRQGSDAASPTRHAPSEVSIEWSIVTASSADFSVMSECATSPVYKQRLKHTNSSTNVTSQ